MKYVPKVLRYLRPYWGLAILAIIGIVFTALLGLITPWPLRIIFDNVLGTEPWPAFFEKLVSHDPFHLAILVVAAQLALVLLENVLHICHDYVTTKLDLKIVLDFRSDMFAHAQRLSQAFHDQSRSGMIIYAINYQADAVAGVILSFPPLAYSALTLVGMFWIVVRMDRQLALLSLVVVPFLYYSVHYYATHIKDRLMQVRQMEGETLSIIHEAISMLRVIVAFGREDYEHERFRSQGVRALGARVKLTVRQQAFSLAVNMTTAVGTALVLGVGLRHALDHKITTGQLWMVLAYIGAVYKPLEQISYTVGTLQDKFISLRIAFELLEQEPEIKDAPDAVTIERSRGHLQFQDVQFAYAGRVDTLKDITFEARPGEVVAVVGPTGAGKTTLISLIPRFYAPASGSIRLDGREVSEITLASLRAQISLVLQEPLLFSGSIAENIRYGRLDATREEIIAAARAANAHDFINALPRKYDTDVGEGGAQLSGGERQRICVARAFLKDSPILILDEPTSSIDSKTESVILDALDRLMVGRTTFIIAHRLSTIRKADKILVVNKGRLVESGSHEDLLALGGLYRQLYDLQTVNGRLRPHREDEEPSDALAAESQ